MVKRRFSSILDLEESILNRQSGFSLIETMLGLAIFCMIFITLIPMTTELYEKAEKRKQSLHAMTVNYEATVIHYTNPQTTNGEIGLDGNTYRWKIEGKKVCTDYNEKQEMRRSCVVYKNKE